MVSPKYLFAITEHSICQPGLPAPHGASHFGSPGLCGFQSTKSVGFFLASSNDTLSLAPAINSSKFFLESFPYSTNFLVS